MVVPSQVLPLRIRVDLGVMAINWYTLHFPKVQPYRNLTIRLFIVIDGTLVGGILPLCRDTIDVFYSPSRLGKHHFLSTNVDRFHVLLNGLVQFGFFNGISTFMAHLMSKLSLVELVNP